MVIAAVSLKVSSTIMICTVRPCVIFSFVCVSPRPRRRWWGQWRRCRRCRFRVVTFRSRRRVTTASVWSWTGSGRRERHRKNWRKLATTLSIFWRLFCTGILDFKQNRSTQIWNKSQISHSPLVMSSHAGSVCFICSGFKISASTPEQRKWV